MNRDGGQAEPRKGRRGPGRPRKPMPERIPDTPENIMRILMNTPREAPEEES